ncbi:anti-repressor SinI family protein [Bacillus sp. FJAT-49736]|nr:anti-repressor SinI family protein [Bacillus sp. FJAT-49736]MBS4173354.1 anti-repressor SinI family protein [Bacillus sp. FJAT-49736]
MMVNYKELDQEWVNLILEALDNGITVQEIRKYFSEKAMEVDVF